MRILKILTMLVVATPFVVVLLIAHCNAARTADRTFSIIMMSVPHVLFASFVWRHLDIWISIIAGLTNIGLTVLAWSMMYQTFAGSPMHGVCSTPIVLSCVVVGEILGLEYYRKCRRQMRHGAEIECERCGYSLIGIAGARCPECGTVAAQLLK
jgi:hypothetical protein